jgi:hypothetical protein
MLLMRADPFRGQVGGGWALEIESFFGPVKWHRFDRRVPFGAQKTRTHQKSLRTLLNFIKPLTKHVGQEGNVATNHKWILTCF